jgi:hypothetical protein
MTDVAYSGQLIILYFVERELLVTIPIKLIAQLLVISGSSAL